MTDTTTAGAEQAAAQKTRLAYLNGMTAQLAGLTCAASNPYVKGRQSYADFIAGFNAGARGEHGDS